MQQKGISRRKFLAAGFAGAAALTFADGFFLEPQDLRARRIDVHLQRLPEAFDGFRIAQISDIHFGPFLGSAGVERAVRLAKTFQPDLFVITGDFVSHPFGKPDGPAGAAFVEPCADVLARWKGMQTIAVLGNHDHANGPAFIAGALKDRGISALRNGAIPMERGKDRFWVAGVDDAWFRAANLDKTLHSVPKNEATVLLAHEPDFADEAARYPIDLQLSGHSHGGQVRTPGIGAIYLPEMGQKYSMGMYRVGQMQIYTNVGLGVIGLPVRFLCPPEVTFLTLKRDTSSRA